MDRSILDRLNDSAKANDILYFLGDFCIGSKTKALEYRKQIRCKKIFAVPGNHDKQIRKLTEEVLLAQQLCGNLHTWPAHRDLSLRHAGLEPLPSWSVAPVRTFSWEPP